MRKERRNGRKESEEGSGRGRVTERECGREGGR